ncbi:MAG TPA: hypothetical protein VGK63_06965 [Candidatus Limnocylindrales bacterium]
MSGAASAHGRTNGRWRLVSAGVIVVVGIAVAIAFLAVSRPTARGVVTRVDTVSLTDVRGFDLRTDAGATLHFEIGQLDLTAPAFNAQHLVVHQATAQPVIVTYEDRNGSLVAVRLLDG